MSLENGAIYCSMFRDFAVHVSISTFSLASPVPPLIVSNAGGDHVEAFRRVDPEPRTSRLQPLTLVPGHSVSELGCLCRVKCHTAQFSMMHDSALLYEVRRKAQLVVFMGSNVARIREGKSHFFRRQEPLRLTKPTSAHRIAASSIRSVLRRSFLMLKAPIFRVGRVLATRVKKGRAF